jgi:F-box/leucine-rich repeat protein 2/20
MRGCRNLQRLVVSYCLVSPGVAVSTLTYLDIRNCEVMDGVVTVVGQHCTKLQTLLAFHGSRSIDDGVRAVLQGCPLLRETDVEYAAALSDDLRVELVKRRELVELRVGMWVGMNDQLLQRILMASPSLTCFQCWNCARLSEATLVVCASFCPLLEDFDLRGCTAITSVGNEWMCSLLKETASKLRRVTLESMPGLDDEALHALAPGCSELEHLNLSGCRLLTTAGACKLIKRCSCLRNVRLCYCPQLGDEVVVALASHCPLLETFQCSEVALTYAAVVKLAQGCARLKEVWIACSKVGDVALFALAVCAKSLQALQIEHCPHVTHVGVRALAEHCTCLQEVRVPCVFRDVLFPKSCCVYHFREL